MKTTIYLILLWTLVSLSSLDARAQSADTEVNYAWLSGSWVGDGFGGTSEEVWSQPSADGTLMGVFRHHSADGTINFYEFMVLDSSGLRLKHFSPDMVGWETKEENESFNMVRVTKNSIELKGLTYKRISDDEMEISLEMGTKDGVRTEIFSMKRKL